MAFCHCLRVDLSSVVRLFPMFFAQLLLLGRCVCACVDGDGNALAGGSGVTVLLQNQYQK